MSNSLLQLLKEMNGLSFDSGGRSVDRGVRFIIGHGIVKHEINVVLKGELRKSDRYAESKPAYLKIFQPRVEIFI